MTTYCSPTAASTLRLDTAERIRKQLTGPQLLALQAAERNVPRGLCTLRGAPNGLRRSSWKRMMDRLVQLGAATEYLDGDYYLTPAGLLVADQPSQQR